MSEGADDWSQFPDAEDEPAAEVKAASWDDFPDAPEDEPDQPAPNRLASAAEAVSDQLAPEFGDAVGKSVDAIKAQGALIREHPLRAAKGTAQAVGQFVAGIPGFLNAGVAGAEEGIQAAIRGDDPLPAAEAEFDRANAAAEPLTTLGGLLTSPDAEPASQILGIPVEVGHEIREFIRRKLAPTNPKLAEYIGAISGAAGGFAGYEAGGKALRGPEAKKPTQPAAVPGQPRTEPPVGETTDVPRGPEPTADDWSAFQDAEEPPQAAAAAGAPPSGYQLPDSEGRVRTYERDDQNRLRRPLVSGETLDQATEQIEGGDPNWVYRKTVTGEPPPERPISISPSDEAKLREEVAALRAEVPTGTPVKADSPLGKQINELKRRWEEAGLSPEEFYAVKPAEAEPAGAAEPVASVEPKAAPEAPKAETQPTDAPVKAGEQTLDELLDALDEEKAINRAIRVRDKTGHAKRGTVEEAIETATSVGWSPDDALKAVETAKANNRPDIVRALVERAEREAQRSADSVKANEASTYASPALKARARVALTKNAEEARAEADAIRAAAEQPDATKAAPAKAYEPIAPDEHTAAAEATGVSPETVDTDGVSALVHLIETDPATAQRMIDEHLTSQALSAAVREHLAAKRLTDAIGAASARRDRIKAGEKTSAARELDPAGEPVPKSAAAEETLTQETPSEATSAVRGDQGKRAQERQAGEGRQEGRGRDVQQAPEEGPADGRKPPVSGQGEKAPAGPAPDEVAQRLADPKARETLQRMAGEAGWEEVGGYAEMHPETGKFQRRTKWIPHAPWFAEVQRGVKMPGKAKVGEAYRAAVHKALAGERLTAVEKRAVTHMLDHAERMEKLDKDQQAAEAEHERQSRLDQFDEQMLEKHGLDHGDEATALDHALAKQVEAIDPDAFERLAVKYADDDAGFTKALEDFVHEHRAKVAADTKVQADEGAAKVSGGEGRGKSAEEKPALDLTAQTEESRRAEEKAKPPESEAKRKADQERDHFALQPQEKPTKVADEENRANQKALFSREDEAADRVAVWNLVAALQKYFGEPFKAGAVKVARLPADIASAARAVVEAFGHRLVIFESSDPRFNANGVVIPGSDNIFLNVKATRPILSLGFHEIGHQMRESRPDLYQILHDVALPRMRNVEKYRAWLDASRRKEGHGPAPDDLLHEEMIMDYVGDNANDASFWRAVYDRAPEKFKELVEHILALVDNVKKSLGSEKYFDDVDGVLRKTLADVLAEYSERSRKRDGGGGEMKFSREDESKPFYSALTRAAETAKVEKALPKDWMGVLRNTPGVKAEELEWSGLEDWLHRQVKAVSKADVAAFLRANEVQVREVMLGDEGMKAFYDRELPNELNRYTKKWGGKSGKTDIAAKEGKFAGMYEVVSGRTGESYAGPFDSEAEAKPHVREGDSVVRIGDEKVHSLDITPQMRDSAMQGQPLFSRLSEEGKRLHSVKNEMVDEERAARGLPPIIGLAKESHGEWWDEAMQRLQQNKTADVELVNELIDKPRGVDPVESALLLNRRIDLQNDYHKALALIDSGDEATAAEYSMRAAKLEDDLDTLDAVSRGVGTEAGRALAVRKMMADEDYNLASMATAYRVAKGGEALTPKDREKVATHQKRIDRTRKVVEEIESKTEERAAKQQATQVVDDLVKKAKQARGKAEKRDNDAEKTAILAGIKHAVSEAQKRMTAEAIAKNQERGWKVPEASVSKLASIFAKKPKAEVKMSRADGDELKFSRGEGMDEEVYGEVKPEFETYLKAAKDAGASVKDFAAGIVEQFGKDAMPYLARFIKDKGLATEISKPREVTVPQRTELHELGGYVQRLAEAYVREGAHTVDALVDKVHGELRKIIPDITRRQTMDAISGYGQFSKLNPDATKVVLRDLKGQAQQIAKLQDMQAGQPPKKTGVERREPSDEERRLIKQVNEAKRRFKVETTDPAKQLKSALDGIKTRLLNQIKDLDFQISTGKKIIKTHTEVPLDAAAKALRDRRNALREQYDAIFKKPGKTDEQRIVVATRAVRDSIESYEKRIASGDLSPLKKAATVSTPALDALRAERDALRAEFEELRDLANPKKSPEERALSAAKKAVARSTAKYQKMLADRQFETPPRQPSYAPDAELNKARAENIAAKKDWMRAKLEERLKRRFWYEKFGDWFNRWRRAFILSSPVVFGKLTAAAVTRLSTAHAEELIGSAWSKVLPSLSALAPREGGGINVRAEVKAATEGFVHYVKHAKEYLKTRGEPEKEMLYGRGREGAVAEHDVAERSISDWIGILHGMLKNPVKESEFARSYEKRMIHAIENGADGSNPLVQFRISVEAWKDAQRSVFLNDNIIVDAYRAVLQTLERPDKTTGHASFAGKTTAVALRTLLPIVRIPTNIVAEVFQYSLGLEIAGGKLLSRAIREAIGKEVKKLSPDEADLIARCLKKGSIGAAALVAGYLMPQTFGGYYQPGEKRKEGEAKAMRMKIGDYNVPTWLLHNPLLETFQAGATIRRVADSFKRKSDLEPRGTSAGVWAALFGAVEEVPFIKEMLELGNLHEDPAGFADELGKSIIVPQAMEWAAKHSDSADDQGPVSFAQSLNPMGDDTPIKRKPETFGEHLRSGIPGMRQTLPVLPAKAPSETHLDDTPFEASVRGANLDRLKDAWRGMKPDEKEAAYDIIMDKIDRSRSLDEDQKDALRDKFDIQAQSTH